MILLKAIAGLEKNEKIAKQNGIYTAADLAKLIVEHSPIKSVGDSKMQWAKRIYREDKKIKNLCIKS